MRFAGAAQDEMRVAIDARELSGHPTGVGRYLAGLLTAWAEIPAARAHEFVLCAPAPINLPGTPAIRAISRRGWHGSRGTWWEQSTLPSMVLAIKADVFFSPGYTAPLMCPAPSVVAMHDVSFAAHPEWFAPREGMRRRFLARLAAQRAARVVTISQFSKREIVRLFGIQESQVDVIYPGTTAPTSSATNDRAASRDEHLVLFVGSLFARRHIPALIDGFARLARQRSDVRLEIVGDNRTTPRVDFHRLVEASGAAARIAIRSYVSDDVLRDLYTRAGAFVFLSEYEGFGLTPIEALAAGVPIAVLDTPVAREVYDEAALYVSKPDPALVRAAIERVLFDAGERTRILAAAGRLLPRYSWRQCAEGILGVLIAAATSRGNASRGRANGPA
jgi:glycosyltransferase involved in cell wall biosynthesis